VVCAQRGFNISRERAEKLNLVVKQRVAYKVMAIGSSMGDVGACWDNAVVERFFGQPEARLDIQSCAANGGMSPIHFETSQQKVSGFD
jgi:transposase InsO family protein